MLIKQERIFALKIFYNSGDTAVINKWNIHQCVRHCTVLTDRFEERGSVMVAPRSTRTKEKKMRVCLAATQSPRKSTRRLASELQHVSRRSV